MMVSARRFGGYLVAALIGLLLPVPAGALLPGILESWETTSVPLRAYDVAVLSDGTPWFSSQPPAGNAVFSFDPLSGTPTPYYLIVPGTAPKFNTLAADQNDVLWIADASDRLVKFEPATGSFTAYPLPGGVFNLPAEPYGVSVAPDGAIWFTCWQDRALGRFDPATATFQRFAPPGGIPDPPVEIAFDATGVAYFTIRRVTGSPGLGRLDDPATNTFTFWLNPYAGAFQPFGIIRVGSVFWFMDHAAGIAPFGNFIVRFDPATAGFWATPLPPELIDSHYVVADDDGRLLFGALVTSRLGRFDPVTATFASAEIPNSPVYPLGIARSSDGVIWFAETGYFVTGTDPPELAYAGVGRYRAQATRPVPVPALGALGLGLAACLLSGIGLIGLRRMRRLPQF